MPEKPGPHPDNREAIYILEKKLASTHNDVEQELFYHIVTDGQEQVVKPEQAAVVTRVLEAVYASAKSGETVYFD